VRDADEMHEALVMLGVVTDQEVTGNEAWAPGLATLATSARATRLSNGLWTAAERLAEVRALYPQAAAQPAIEPPAEYASSSGGRDDLLRDLLRSRLAGLGPVTVEALVSQLRLPRDEVGQALLGLQTEGTILQGRFTPGTQEVEWCERHLLARIHRYTLKRLRQEIEPVEPRDFMRFLFDWQQAGPHSQVEGPEALPAVLSLLEGYEAPAGQWEAEILPARLRDYSSAWLDDLCTAGRTMWTRLRPLAGNGSAGKGGGASLRLTPVLLLPRRSAALWARVAPVPADEGELGSRAQRLVEHLSSHGASFFDEMLQGTRLLQSELEDALAELVVRGRVNCDSFAGLRALMVPASKRPSNHGGRSRHRRPLFGIEDAGRWSLVRQQPAVAPEQAPTLAADDLEHIVRTLLRRYGVIAWRLLEREAAWLPKWRDLVRVCRRLEARGELRGGRFIAGLSGEQFALPEAVARMREVRRQPLDAALVCLAAADPANLLGTLLPGPKLPRTAGSRVLYRDGVPVATLAGGEVETLVTMAPAERNEAVRELSLDPGHRRINRPMPELAR
jgi:ATP-dependent Lhr-like helicase